MSKSDSPSPFPLRATAVVLAGGASRRMKRDKALLPIGGVTMLEHVCRQLQPLFSHLCISASKAGKYEFLGLPVVLDETPGLGPIMAVLSALRASPTPRLFVTACDIPQLDLPFLGRMALLSDRCPLVVPRYESGQMEPLFAFYHRDAIPALAALVEGGERKIAVLYDHFPTCFLPADDQPCLANINTAEDYRRLSGNSIPK